MSSILTVKVKIIVRYGNFLAFLAAVLIVMYVDFPAAAPWCIILHSMLLQSEEKGNYCFKNIKLLLIVCSSLSNLSLQVYTVHSREGCGLL